MQNYYQNNKDEKWYKRQKTQEYKDKKNRDRRIKYQTDENYRNKIKKAVKEYNAKNPDVKFAQHLSEYNLTIDDYKNMLAKQGNRCAICGSLGNENNKFRKLYIDHSHTTGKVRGLLCNNCNFMIGHAKEDVNILMNAIKYLEEHKDER